MSRKLQKLKKKITREKSRRMGLFVQFISSHGCNLFSPQFQDYEKNEDINGVQGPKGADIFENRYMIKEIQGAAH